MEEVEAAVILIFICLMASLISTVLLLLDIINGYDIIFLWLVLLYLSLIGMLAYNRRKPKKKKK